MSNGYAKTVSDLLREAEWQLVRQHKGSHAVWQKPGADRPITVSVNLHDRNMAKRILKQAGIPAGLIR